MKLCEVDKTKLAPMMAHYVELKEKNLDTIILYRLGDFYEMFFEDAELVSHELELTLTGRNAGLEERVPMCGVPYHAVDIYIDKLIKKGYRVSEVDVKMNERKGGTSSIKSWKNIYYMINVVLSILIIGSRRQK